MDRNMGCFLGNLGLNKPIMTIKIKVKGQENRIISKENYCPLPSIFIVVNGVVYSINGVAY